MRRLFGGSSTFRAASKTTRSPISMVPPVGSSSPAMHRSDVVLPQPLGPSSVTSEPFGTSKSTPSTARTPPGNSLTSPRTLIIASSFRDWSSSRADENRSFANPEPGAHEIRQERKDGDDDQHHD